MTGRRAERVELITRALQAAPSRGELRGETAAVETFRQVHEPRPQAEPFSFPVAARRRVDPPRAGRPRARILAAAGPLTIGVSVVAVAALAVPMITGLVGREPHSSSTAAPKASSTSTIASSPSVEGTPTQAPTPSATATGTSPSAVPPSPTLAPTGSHRTGSPAPGRSTAPAVPTATPSTGGSPSRDHGGQGKADSCRTWLLVGPDTGLGMQLLAQLSDGRTRSSHAADVAAVDNFCRSVVGQNPPRCRADGSIDPSTLREGRSAWRQNPWYAPWCLAVTGHAAALCTPWGMCPPIWWRCPTWGCLSVPKSEQPRTGSQYGGSQYGGSQSGGSQAGGSQAGRRTAGQG